MTDIHWVTRQNKLETPTEKDEVNKREVHECHVKTMMSINAGGQEKRIPTCVCFFATGLKEGESRGQTMSP
jgi:hypothetical protein